MAILKIHDGISFVTAIGKVHDGVAFSEKMHFHDGVAFVPLFAAVIGPLIVSVTPTSLNEFDPDCPFTSSALTAAVSGGVGPFTFLWTWFSGGAGLTILSPTSSSTSIRTTSSGAKSGTLRCTVTDSLSTEASDDTSIILECGLL